MTIESAIFDTLKGLVSNRVFPDVNTSNPLVAPYITYQQVGGNQLSFIERTSPALRNARVQVSVWAKTRAEASSLMRQAEVALVESSQTGAEPMGAPVSRYDEDTKLFGSFQFFSIWFQ